MGDLIVFCKFELDSRLQSGGWGCKEVFRFGGVPLPRHSTRPAQWRGFSFSRLARTVPDSSAWALSGGGFSSFPGCYNNLL